MVAKNYIIIGKYVFNIHDGLYLSDELQAFLNGYAYSISDGDSDGYIEGVYNVYKAEGVDDDYKVNVGGIDITI